MHADICDPDDAPALLRFQNILRELGAQPGVEVPVSGLQMLFVTIGAEHITVFMDSLSVDIAGPPQLVQSIVGKMKEAI
jgi:hypothetical protein